MADKPLSGVKVLDLGQGVAAPGCGLLLAQYGAEVIKVEPLAGDWMRGLGAAHGGHTAYSIYYNRGKRGLAVDLKNPAGLEIVRRIAADSQVVLENFRPGVVDRLGIGFEDVKALNPKTLYVSISGFGQHGPFVDRPGSDTVLQAFSGLISINRDIDGRPHRVGTTMIDALTAMCAFQAVSMALFAGVESARRLDVSLLQSAALLLAPNIGDFHLNGGPVPPLNAPAGTYRTRDGWVAVSLVREENFAALCRALDLPAVAQDARFSSFARRAENLPECLAALQERLLDETTATWVERCTAAGVLVSPINDFGDWLENQQVRATGAWDMLDQPGVGGVPTPRLPGGQKVTGVSPGRGRDSRHILADYGYGPDEIDALVRNGVIDEPEDNR